MTAVRCRAGDERRQRTPQRGVPTSGPPSRAIPLLTCDTRAEAHFYNGFGVLTYDGTCDVRVLGPVMENPPPFPPKGLQKGLQTVYTRVTNSIAERGMRNGAGK
jgi:hypothetical protein